MANPTTERLVKLHSAMLTDVGIVREHNEDSAYVDSNMRFFIVADGMGGHAAGEVASAMAVEGVCEGLELQTEQLQAFADSPSVDGRQVIAQILEQAVRDAHKSVFDRGSTDPEKQGMGTTLDVLLISGQEAFVAHVGDSRTYLMRGNSAAQITTDHTVAEVLVIEGKLSAEEALVSPLRTILVNALGVSAEVGVEMAHLTLHKNDRILICSDGLHDYFPQEEELYEQVTANTPEVALENLIEAAKDRGGHDNITAIIVEVLDAPETEEISTVPIPTVRVASDGIPHAISKDDTAPIDSGILRRSKGMDRAVTEPLEPDTEDQDENEFSGEDLRKTLPMRKNPTPVVADVRDTLELRVSSIEIDENESDVDD